MKLENKVSIGEMPEKIKKYVYEVFDDTYDKLLRDCFDETVIDEDLSKYFNI